MDGSTARKMQARRNVARIAATTLVAVFGFAATAGADWDQIPGGPTPVTGDATQFAIGALTANVGGVPYVLWADIAGSPFKLHVARLTGSGTWERVAPSSPIAGPTGDVMGGFDIESIGGVPYVAWMEDDDPTAGTNYQVRVARLNGAGTAWMEVVGGASPISVSTGAYVSGGVDLEAIAGVPHIAWSESVAGRGQIRAAKLNGAETAWEQIATGAQINNSTATDATQPSLASIGGELHVSWSEGTHPNQEIYVAKVNGAGTAWVQLGGGEPSDVAPGITAVAPHLLGFDGAPHVAWVEDSPWTEVRVARFNASGPSWAEVGTPASAAESPISSGPNHAFGSRMAVVDGRLWVMFSQGDGTNEEIRVSRLNAAGTAWSEVVGGASPVNASADQTASPGRLLSINGVPFVSWVESSPVTAVNQVRVARLEPEIIGQTAADVAATTATLSVQFTTYGLKYPLGIQYGTAFDQQTPFVVPAGAGETATITEQVSGLSPATAYSYRGVAQAGVATPLVLGPAATFQTAASPPSDPPPDQPSRDVTAPETTIDKAPKDKLKKRKAKYAFSSSEPGSTFTCTVDKRPAKPCSSPLRLKRLKDGKHKFAVAATDAAGNTDSSPARDKFKVRTGSDK